MADAVFAECKACELVFKVATVPMPLGEFADMLLKSRCPRCNAGTEEMRLYEPGFVPRIDRKA